MVGGPAVEATGPLAAARKRRRCRASDGAVHRRVVHPHLRLAGRAPPAGRSAPPGLGRGADATGRVEVGGPDPAPAAGGVGIAARGGGHHPRDPGAAPRPRAMGRCRTPVRRRRGGAGPGVAPNPRGGRSRSRRGASRPRGRVGPPRARLERPPRKRGRSPGSPRPTGPPSSVPGRLSLLRTPVGEAVPAAVPAGLPLPRRPARPRRSPRRPGVRPAGGPHRGARGVVVRRAPRPQRLPARSGRSRKRTS